MNFLSSQSDFTQASGIISDDYSLDALIAKKELFKADINRRQASGEIDELEKSILVALFLHDGIIRNNGGNYFDHVDRTANPEKLGRVQIGPLTQRQRIDAYGHDSIEETTPEKNLKRKRVEELRAPWTLKDFVDINYSLDNICDIKILNNEKKQPYLDYAEFVSLFLNPAVVKLSDSTDNHADDPLGDKPKLYLIVRQYFFQTINNPDLTPPGSSIAAFARRAGLYDESLFSKHYTGAHQAPRAGSDFNLT